MTTQQIAARLKELCSQGQFEAAQKELFSNEAVSIEPEASPQFEKETKGLKAIFEKGEKFNAMVEQVYSCTLSEPLVSGNAIALSMTMDMTMKGRERSAFSELCIYQVKDGKIISEQFFM